MACRRICSGSNPKRATTTSAPEPLMRIKLYRILALLLTLFPPAFAGAQELLDPAVAFKFSAQAIDAGTIEVRYRIADGYYMYRDKFKFAVEPATVKLGTAQFPNGDIHNDEFFGKVE